MGYDEYAAAKTLADHLDAEGQNVWAEAIRNIIIAGSTGTEIFMGLRWHLQQLKVSAVPLSTSLGQQLEDLLKKLESALS